MIVIVNTTDNKEISALCIKIVHFQQWRLMLSLGYMFC